MRHPVTFLAPPDIDLFSVETIMTAISLISQFGDDSLNMIRLASILSNHDSIFNKSIFMPSIASASLPQRIAFVAELSPTMTPSDGNQYLVTRHSVRKQVASVA